MTGANVIVLGLDSGKLHHGTTFPSVGYALIREIFQQRADAGSVIHLHVDECIAYFSVMHRHGFPLISADAAIVLGSPVSVLPPEVNVEADAKLVREFIADTNAFVMANHGVTVLGSSLQEAYYRLNTLVAEVRRVLMASLLASSRHEVIPHLTAEEEQNLYDLAKRIL